MARKIQVHRFELAELAGAFGRSLVLAANVGRPTPDPRPGRQLRFGNLARMTPSGVWWWYTRAS